MKIHGRGYVIEHCISSYKNSMKEMQYKVYVTDMLKNFFDYATSGKADVPRFYDQINEPEEPQETAEDVIARIMQGLTEIGS